MEEEQENETKIKKRQARSDSLLLGVKGERREGLELVKIKGKGNNRRNSKRELPLRFGIPSKAKGIH